MNSTFQFGIHFRLIDINPDCMYLIVPIEGYCFPVMAVLVSVVNMLAVFVFLQPRVRSHTTFILTLIASADMLNILVPSIIYVYYYTLGHYKDYLRYRFCFLTYIFGDVSLEYFNSLSLWLTVLLAYIRCTCLKSPFNAHNIHTSKRIAMYITFILIFTTIYHLPSLFLYDFSPDKVEDVSTNETKELCVITESSFIFPNSSMDRKLYFCTETLLDSIVPCFILVYLDFVILLTLKEAKRSRSSLRRYDQTKYHDTTPTEQSGSGLPTELELKRKCFRTGLKVECRSTENYFSKTSLHNREIHISDNENSKPKYKIHKGSSPGLCSKLGCFRAKHESFRMEQTGTIDSAFDKLDRENRRTSWLILMVATIITLHEIPLAATNVYLLVKHAGVSLPLNVYGCLSVFLLLWQYVTYLVIFIIYAFMSGAFRTELKRLLRSKCIQRSALPTVQKKVFMSPCSLRKTISRDQDTTAGPIHDSDSEVDSRRCP